MSLINLPLPFFGLITFFILIFPNITSSQPTYLYSICPNNTLFSNTTQYQTNLNTVFDTLSSNATTTAATGFHYTSAGDNTKDAVYGDFLCRGDQNITACNNCVATATTDLPKYCPNTVVAATWYDECMVRYSNTSFYGKMDQTPRFRLENTQNLTSNVTTFVQVLDNMLNNLAIQGANGGPNKKYATNVVEYTSLQTLYGMVQCTPDLSSSECNRCLNIAIGVLPISIGGRTMQASCFVRYELYPFFDGSFNVTVAPPPAAVTNSTGIAPTLSPRTTNGHKSKTTKMIIAIIVPLAAISTTLLAIICICFVNKKTKKNEPAESNAASLGDDFTDIESLQYSFTTLEHATNYFSDENKLGEGGFGCIYKGKLSDGKEVAVKRLSRNSTHGVQEFKNEVLLVAKLQHRNLTRLLGFCVAGNEKLLVYEYVPNKSLDNFLFDSKNKERLDWGTRYKIIQGIARGMLYLHQDSRLTIVHRDLKPSNILLDSDMNPKISDFGMARIFGSDQTEGNTSSVVGTYGYMSPEYAMHGQFSTKSDVYSFGCLILEIISGQRNSASYDSGKDDDLLSQAWEKWKKGVPLEFLDQTIKESYSNHEVLRCIHLGLLCVNESADKRPTIATIVLTLDSNSVTLLMPEEPAFYTKTRVAVKLGNEIGSDQSGSKSVNWSVNSASISEIEPR